MKHKINLNYYGATVEVFCWTVSLVCGTMADVADSKISNQPVTFESNLIGIVQFEFESNLKASQIHTMDITVMCSEQLMLDLS